MITNRLGKRLQDLPENIWKLIAEIGELRGQWIGGARLNPQILGRLKRSVLSSSSGASTRIEGASLSDNDVEKLMSGLKMAQLIDRDKQEVQGYYELLTKVFDVWDHIRFSENTIKHFHQELLRHVTKDERHRGDYKKGENKVEMFDQSGKSLGVVFDTTPSYLTPKEMQELVEWTMEAVREKTHHPLLIIGNFIVEFLNIHPFQDGNGRLSRILTNLLLLQAGYKYIPYISHEKIVEENKSNYYLALRQTQKTFGTAHEDITPWLAFFLGCMLEQSKQAVRLLSPKNIEKLLSPKQLAVLRYIQSVDEATPGEITKHTGAARPTVNQALTVLLKLNRIERIGQGRTTRYRDISQK